MWEGLEWVRLEGLFSASAGAREIIQMLMTARKYHAFGPYYTSLKLREVEALSAYQLLNTCTHQNTRTWPSVNQPHSNHLDDHLHRKKNVEYHLAYVGRRDQHLRVRRKRAEAYQLTSAQVKKHSLKVKPVPS